MKRYNKYKFTEHTQIDAVKSNLLKYFNKYHTKNCDELALIHNFISKEEVNDFRLKAFSELNKLEWKTILYDHCYGNIKDLIGPDLLIQKKINLSIQMPSDTSSILSAHSDCSSGDSPFEIVLWIPLTEAYSSNSMFIYDKKKSKGFYDSIKIQEPIELKPKESDFVTASYGEYIIFSPSLVHGNTLNTTKETRISLNIRFKSIFSPYTPTIVNDRLYGTYYDVWHTSDMYRWGKEVYQLLK